ncbi:MAG: response regulator transcription factor [Thermoleophilia bacterium]
MSETGSITLGIVDDHQVVQDGIRLLAERTDGFEFWGASGSAADLLRRLERGGPDILLLDLRIGRDDGMALCRAVRERAPETQVVVFTAFGELELLRQSVDAGAAGFVLKGTSTRDLPAILRHVRERGSYCDPELASEVVVDVLRGRADARPRVDLGEREREILRLVAEGKVNREIAQTLCLSVHTVKYYLSRMMRDLGAGRRAELVKAAVDRGLLRATE